MIYIVLYASLIYLNLDLASPSMVHFLENANQFKFFISPTATCLQYTVIIVL